MTPDDANRYAHAPPIKQESVDIALGFVAHVDGQKRAEQVREWWAYRYPNRIPSTPDTD